MQPRLILLTGPAARDTAFVFADAVCQLSPRWWDEIREFDHLVEVMAVTAIGKSGGLWTAGEERRQAGLRLLEAIRAQPGGEAWLVGLVLPERGLCMSNGHQYPLGEWKWGCARCREARGVPSRLAILAPEPPDLLLERVRSWDGEVWLCVMSAGTVPKCCICINGDLEDDGGSKCRDTWPEAVAAALDEEISSDGFGELSYGATQENRGWHPENA